MEHEAFERWLSDYGEAWETRDPQRTAALFTPDGLYYWTPFDEPNRGRNEIAQAAADAVSGQKDIHFRSEILAIVGNRGIARWWCSFVRLKTERSVRLEGIFQVDFADSGLCEEFREWWHRDEDTSH